MKKNRGMKNSKKKSKKKRSRNKMKRRRSRNNKKKNYQIVNANFKAIDNKLSSSIFLENMITSAHF